MKEKVLEGRSLQEIAERHGVDKRTVSRALTWADRANIFIEIEDQILHELAPLAVDALKHALQTENDPNVALEILKGLNIIKKTHAVTGKEVKEQNDLAGYIDKIRDAAALDQQTVAGELVEAPKPLQLAGIVEPTPEPPQSVLTGEHSESDAE